MVGRPPDLTCWAGLCWPRGAGYVRATRSVYHIVCSGSSENLGPFQGAAVLYETVHPSRLEYFFESASDGTSADSIALLNNNKYMVRSRELNTWRSSNRVKPWCRCDSEALLSSNVATAVSDGQKLSAIDDLEMDIASGATNNHHTIVCGNSHMLASADLKTVFWSDSSWLDYHGLVSGDSTADSGAVVSEDLYAVLGNEYYVEIRDSLVVEVHRDAFLATATDEDSISSALFYGLVTVSKSGAASGSVCGPGAAAALLVGVESTSVNRSAANSEGRAIFESAPAFHSGHEATAYATNSTKAPVDGLSAVPESIATSESKSCLEDASEAETTSESACGLAAIPELLAAWDSVYTLMAVAESGPKLMSKSLSASESRAAFDSICGLKTSYYLAAASGPFYTSTAAFGPMALSESKYGATAASEYLAVAALDSAGWPAVDFVAVQATESVGSSAAALMETAASELIVMAIAAPNLVLVFAEVQIAIRSQFTYELLRGFQVRVVSESVELDNLSNRGSRFVAVLVLNIFNVPSRWMNFYRDIELLLYRRAKMLPLPPLSFERQQTLTGLFETVLFFELFCRLLVINFNRFFLCSSVTSHPFQSVVFETVWSCFAGLLPYWSSICRALQFVQLGLLGIFIFAPEKDARVRCILHLAFFLLAEKMSPQRYRFGQQSPKLSENPEASSGLSRLKRLCVILSKHVRDSTPFTHLKCILKWVKWVHPWLTRILFSEEFQVVSSRLVCFGTCRALCSSDNESDHRQWSRMSRVSPDIEVIVKSIAVLQTWACRDDTASAHDVLFAIELAKERSMLNLLPGLYGSRTTILRDVNTELSAARPGSPARQGAGHE